MKTVYQMLQLVVNQLENMDKKIDDIKIKLDNLEKGVKNPLNVYNNSVNSNKSEEYDHREKFEKAIDKLDKEKLRQRLEEVARKDARYLISGPQLPYKYFGINKHRYIPDKENPINIIVNKEKRTVVALLKSAGKVIKVGKSKCHPDDVFSNDIGIIIAIRRLFDLDVLDIYTKNDLSWGDFK